MGDRQELEDIARERIVQIGKIKDALRHAVATFATAGESRNIKPENWSLANPWSNKLDEIIDTSFFEHLQTEHNADNTSERERIRNEWLHNGADGVVDHAANILHDATNSLPCPAIHRYRARVNAEGLFEGKLRGNGGLPFLFDKASEESTECPNNNRPTAPESNSITVQMPLFL